MSYLYSQPNDFRVLFSSLASDQYFRFSKKQKQKLHMDYPQLFQIQYTPSYSLFNLISSIHYPSSFSLTSDNITPLD